MTREKAISRARKLLAQAHRTDGKESASFAERAAAIVEQYGLTKEDLAEGRVLVDHRCELWRKQLAVAVSIAYGGRVYREPDGLHIACEDRWQAETAARDYTRLALKLRELCASHCRSHRFRGDRARIFADVFLLGAAVRLTELQRPIDNRAGVSKPMTVPKPPPVPEPPMLPWEKDTLDEMLRQQKTVINRDGARSVERIHDAANQSVSHLVLVVRMPRWLLPELTQTSQAMREHLLTIFFETERRRRIAEAADRLFALLRRRPPKLIAARTTLAVEFLEQEHRKAWARSLEIE